MAWEPMSLKQAGVALIDCVHATPNPVTSGYPYIAIPQMTGGRIKFDDARQISADDFAAWTRKACPKKHDVVLSRRTNPGVTAPVSDRADFALGQNLVLLRADGSRVLPEFLRWLATSPQWWGQIEKFMNVGAIFNSLRCADVPNFVLSIPPLADQQPIAEILSALDDKIELNRRVNQTLESSARALFRDWFVDFGPTRAQAEGRPAYLAPDLWSLFPDRLDDNGVPEGWPLARLADHTTVIKGRSYSSAELSASPTALVTLKSFERGGGYRRDGLKPYTGPFKEEQVVSNGEIIISQTDVTQAAELIGRPARVVVDTRFERLVASLDVAILRPSIGSYLDREFLFGLTDNQAFTHHALAHTTGTTVLHLAKNAVPSFEFVLPGAPVVDAFQKCIGPFHKKVADNVQENDTLAATRDALLPKLMSGELRVRDAEALAA